MDSHLAPRRLTERGIGSVQFLLASGLALLLFVAFANLVAVQYGRGAVRSAVEQAARAGALTGSPAHCEATGVGVVEQLLAGTMSDDLLIRCELSGSSIVARAEVVFESWTPLTPDIPIRLSVESPVER